MSKFIRFLCVAAMLCMLFATPLTAAAETANAYLAFSSNTVTVGATFTVTASFTASSIGAVSAKVTYDPAVVQFVSGGNAAGGNGTVNLAYAATADSGSMKFPLTFKALAAGSCAFSVSGSEVISWGFAPLGSPSAGATLKVQAAATSATAAATQRPSTTTTKRPTTTGSTTTTAPTEPLTLTLGGVTYSTRTPDAAAVPAGFTESTLQFGAQALTAYRSENEAISLVYLAADSADAAWYIADTVADAVYPFRPLTIGGAAYYLLSADAPDGFTETTVTREDGEFAVFAFGDTERAEFAVFRAISAEGSVGWFCWDMAENTVQRYVPLTTAATTATTTTTTAAATTGTVPTTAALFGFATLGTLPWLVAGGLLLVCIALAILACIFYRRALPTDSHHTPRH
ncbi:MAG: hypothetical protein E7552_07400 [Ruminococcaceae bacterium]|nr:hypothetical protein [Oscillospiraceae bacterium]